MTHIPYKAETNCTTRTSSFNLLDHSFKLALPTSLTQMKAATFPLSLEKKMNKSKAKCPVTETNRNPILGCGKIYSNTINSGLYVS